MSIHGFDFSSGERVEYKLRVTTNGFILVDAVTGELLVDASLLITESGKLSHWPVGIATRSTNRDFYFSCVPMDVVDKVDQIEFGLTKRK